MADLLLALPSRVSVMFQLFRKHVSKENEIIPIPHARYMLRSSHLSLFHNIHYI
jgi:hypothetical protein